MKKTILLSLIMTTMLSASAQKNEFQGFAFRLFDKVQQQKDTPNCVMSPYSAQMALTLLTNGLTEDAAIELKTVMGVEGYTLQQLNEYNRESINNNRPQWAELEDGETNGGNEQNVPSAEIANAVFLANGLLPNTNFSNICTTYYDGTIENIDFSSPATPEYIDNWANEKTHGTIPQLNLDMNGETKMIIANALYFHGAWSQPFTKEKTPQPFHSADGTMSFVPTMKSFNEPSKGMVWDEMNVKAASITYGKDDSYNMTIYMPIDRDKELAFDYTLWKEVKGKMKTYNVTTTMPIFTVDTSYELNDILKSLGATRIFTEPCITGIADMSMTVSETKQIAHISVDENGTTASAVTIIGTNGVGPSNEELEFNVDGAFYFTIEHNDEILFIGHVGNLSSEETTSITHMTSKPEQDGTTYNTLGQRVGQTYKGIVIRNGRKYINR